LFFGNDRYQSRPFTLVEESVQKQLDMQIVNHGLKFLSIFIASARIWVDGIEAGMT